MAKKRCHCSRREGNLIVTAYINVPEKHAAPGNIVLARTRFFGRRQNWRINHVEAVGGE